MLQKLKTPQQAYEEQRALALSTQDFPADKIHESFKELLHKALPFNSKLNVGAHPLTWRNFIKFERPFKLTEFKLALDVLERATPKEMGQTLEENEDMLLKIVYPMVASWDAIDEEISEKIKREIDTKVKLDLSAPIGKKLFAKEK